MKKILFIALPLYILATTPSHAFDADAVMDTVTTVVKKAGSAAAQVVTGAVSGSNAARIQNGEVQNVNQHNQGGNGNVNAVNYNNVSTMVTSQGVIVNGTATQVNSNGNNNVNGLNVNQADTGLLIQHLKVRNLKQTNTGGQNNVNCGNCSIE